MGDQNDDGYNDWAVYAAGTGTSAYVEFFHGGNPPSQEPYMVIRPIEGLEAGIRGANTVGDINGDGYVDWYVFVGYINNPDQRRVFNFYCGGPTATETPSFVTTTPILSLFYPIGDFNGDGFDDLVLSDGLNDHKFVVFGGSPMDTLPDIELQTHTLLGSGDLNGDGYSDLVMLNQDSEVRYVNIYLGSDAPDSTTDYSWPWPNCCEPDPVDDLNGDGFDDLVQNAGNATIRIRFGAQVLDSTVDAVLNFVPFNVPDDFFSAGDLNRDGYQDLISVDLSYDPYGSYVTVHMGGAAINPDPRLILNYLDPPFNGVPFETAAGLGDVNGDSVDDFAISTLEHPYDDRGTVYIYGGIGAGANDPRPELPRELSVSVYPNPFNAQTILSLDIPFGVDQMELCVVNVLGQTVSTRQIPVAPGHFDYSFDGRDLASGVYLLRVDAGKWREMQKVVVLK